MYESARYQGLPLLVTTDSVLNAYHGLFDTLLQRLEEESLFAQAVVMTEALYDAASDQWNSAADPGIKEEARLNMAYFSVAGSLLAGAASGPEVVQEEVDAELALIEAAGGLRNPPCSVTPRTTASTSLVATTPAARSSSATSRP